MHGRGIIATAALWPHSAWPPYRAGRSLFCASSNVFRQLRCRHRTRSLAECMDAAPLQRPSLASFRVATISRGALPVLCFERSSKEKARAQPEADLAAHSELRQGNPVATENLIAGEGIENVCGKTPAGYFV